MFKTYSYWLTRFSLAVSILSLTACFEVSSFDDADANSSVTETPISQESSLVEQGKLDFENKCTACHSVGSISESIIGLIHINPDQLTYSSKKSEQSSSSIAGLSTFIKTYMQSGGECLGRCADGVATYIWSLKNSPDKTDDGNGDSSDPGNGSGGNSTILNGKTQFQKNCSVCHTSEGSPNIVGIHPFNVDKFTFASKFSGASSETVEGLAAFIENYMQRAGQCSGACADDTAAYLWSLKTTIEPPVGNGTADITNITFNELGLDLDITCSPDLGNVDLKLFDPLSSQVSVGDFSAVTSRASGLMNAIDTEMIATSNNGSLVLTGEGDDIWADKIYFNGLAKNIVGGELDLTVDLNSVTGDNIHDFAKIGILASSTNDLTGELVFIHWSGRNGISVDSGSGQLNGFEALLSNPVSGSETPTPTTLRVVYSNNQLQLGGCYNCANPSMDNASINFIPKRVFVIASSHNNGSLQAAITIDDANASKNSLSVYEEPIACTGSPVTVSILDNSVLTLKNIDIAVYSNNVLAKLVKSKRGYSESASCEIQNELLTPQIRRLSEVQFKNSIIDIFGDRFEDEVWPELEDGVELIGMSNSANRLMINNLNFERLYTSSRAIVTTLLDNDAEFQSCANSSSSNCVSNMMTEYGLQLWRRPLSASEISNLNYATELEATNEKKLELLFNTLLLSSNFLFRSEAGIPQSTTSTLDNYEIASLLSYTIWNSTPDDILLNAAAGSAFTEDEILLQVDRMLDHPRANSAFMEVFKDYLKLELVKSRDKLPEYNFTDQVRQDLLKSAELMILDGIIEDRSLTDVFLGSDFYVNNNIASIFDITASSTDLRKINLDSSQRDGLLNHPAFLSVHSTLSSSGIVKRGVFTVEQLMCQVLGSPPAAIPGIDAPELDPETTSSRVLLQATHSSQSACIGCHKFIDPAGFGFENFDAIGRYRIFEKGNVPIDSSGVLEVGNAPALVYNNSSDYSRELASSPQMNACVSQRFLEHYLGQELEQNSCELERYQKLVMERGNKVTDLIYALIELESLIKRAEAAGEI